MGNISAGVGDRPLHGHPRWQYKAEHAMGGSDPREKAPATVGGGGGQPESFNLMREQQALGWCGFRHDCTGSTTLAGHEQSPFGAKKVVPPWLSSLYHVIQEKGGAEQALAAAPRQLET